MSCSKKCPNNQTSTVVTKTVTQTPYGPKVEQSQKVVKLPPPKPLATSTPKCPGAAPPPPPVYVSSCPATSTPKPRKVNVRPTLETPLSPITKLKKTVFRDVLALSTADPGAHVRATGSAVSRTRQPIVTTKAGPEKVVQQMVMEKVVQRTPKAQYIHKYIRGVDVSPCGEAKQVEMSAQEIDPGYGADTADVNEIISVTSAVSVTASGKRHTIRRVKKNTAKADSLAGKTNLNPNLLGRLIKEEQEDVDNTLRMIPPSVVSQSPGKYPLRKRWQVLRLASESMAALEKTVPRPIPTADEIDYEIINKPIVMASILNTMEKGGAPQGAPDQFFNTLFPDVKEQQIPICPLAPGPFEDVVIPCQSPLNITQEMLNDDMENTVLSVQNIVSMPKDDTASLNSISPKKRSESDNSKCPTTSPREKIYWTSDDVTNVSILVGTDPIFTMDSISPATLDESTDLNVEFANGIEYFLNASVTGNQIQLRGSRLPSWFPGYVSVFPQLPDLCKLNKSPSRVLHQAWNATIPRMFTEDQVLIL